MTLIDLQQVGKSYDAAHGQRLTVLREVDLAVDRGESVAIVGPSGCGKSTLLNVIGALDTADSGRVAIDGQSLGELNETQLAKLRSRRIGFIFQQHHLLPQCSVLENVLVPTLVTDAANRKAAPDRAALLLHRVGLADRLEHRPSQLSGGECQRVAVVRALINRPDIVLADEPTGALDHDNAMNLIELLIELNGEQHTALVMVTHARELAERMQRTLRLIDGRLQAPTPDGN